MASLGTKELSLNTYIYNYNCTIYLCTFCWCACVYHVYLFTTSTASYIHRMHSFFGMVFTIATSSQKQSNPHAISSRKSAGEDLCAAPKDFPYNSTLPGVFLTCLLYPLADGKLLSWTGMGRTRSCRNSHRLSS